MKNLKSGLIVVLIIAAVSSGCASYRTTSNISSAPLPAVSSSTKVLISEDSLPNLNCKEIGSIEVSVKKLTVFHKDPTQEQVNEALAEKARDIGADAVINVTYESGIGTWTWGYMNAKGMGVRLTDGNYSTKANLEKEFEVNEGKGYVYLKGKGKITQPDGSFVIFEVPSKPKTTIQSNLDVNLTWGCIAEAESYKIYWTSRKDGKLDLIRFLESRTCYVTHQTDFSIFPITYYVVAVKGTMESQPSKAAQAQLYSSENGKKCQLCGAPSVGYCHLRNIYVCSSHNTFTDRSGKRWQCP